MNRFLATVKLDAILQLRTNLYTIGLAAGAIVAVALAWLASPDQLVGLIPTLMLLVVGGSTLLYVAALIIFEKDERTINAVVVSPLRTSEYLWSKIITLTLLATVESIIMIGGTMLIMSFSERLTWPNIPLLLIGIVAIAIIYTLTGIVLVVRYDKITDFLIPMSAVAVILQLPFLYFLGWVKLPIFLLIPTSAPTVLMQGAYTPLEAWQWLYGVSYTAALIIGLSIWSHRAFQKHIIWQIK